MFKEEAAVRALTERLRAIVSEQGSLERLAGLFPAATLGHMTDHPVDGTWTAKVTRTTSLRPRDDDVVVQAITHGGLPGFVQIYAPSYGLRFKGDVATFELTTWVLKEQFAAFVDRLGLEALGVVGAASLVVRSHFFVLVDGGEWHATPGITHTISGVVGLGQCVAGEPGLAWLEFADEPLARYVSVPSKFEVASVQELVRTSPATVSPVLYRWFLRQAGAAPGTDMFSEGFVPPMLATQRNLPLLRAMHDELCATAAESHNTVHE